MTYTRGQVRDLVIQACDLENTSVQTNAELNRHINDAARYVHDFLISTLGYRYSVNEATATTASGTNVYDISATGDFEDSLGNKITDFYRPVGVRVTFDDLSYPLGTFSGIDEVRRTSSTAWGPGYMPRYTFEQVSEAAWKIRFEPTPDAAHVVTVRYHPTAPQYSSDSDSVLLPFVDLLVYEAARRVQMKNQRDASSLLSERDAIQKRIEDWASPIDQANPETTLRLRQPRSTWTRRDRLF